MGMAQSNNNDSVSPATWGIPASIPASVSLYGKNFVVISGPELSRRLEELHASGVREVEIVLDVPGHRLMATGKIYVLRKRNTVYYYIYPHGAAQRLLRELYYKYRNNAPAGAKKPMHAIVITILPRKGS
jgi:hypothetical protein